MILATLTFIVYFQRPVENSTFKQPTMSEKVTISMKCSDHMEMDTVKYLIQTRSINILWCLRVCYI